MRLLISPKSSRSTRLRLLCWSANLLVVAGCLALVWCGSVLLQAYLYQKRADHYLAVASNVESRRASDRFLLPSSPPIEGTLIGWIDIPRIGVSSAVLEGTDKRTLRLGVGHIEETALPETLGNIVLAGHRDTFFRHLREIHLNDEIIFRTLNGCYTYTVESTTVVDPSDVEVLNSVGKPMLTLVTCYPFDFLGAAPKRFIVRAGRIDAPGSRGFGSFGTVAMKDRNLREELCLKETLW